MSGRCGEADVLECFIGCSDGAAHKWVLSRSGVRLEREIRASALAFAAHALLLCVSPAQAETATEVPPLPKVNARALYVSCYLVTQGVDVPRPAPDRVQPFSAITCGLYAVHAVGLREGRRDAPGGFCMGKSDHPAVEIASAYVLHYEAHPFSGPVPDGEARFNEAMQWRWPCRAR